jgi:hypothetical protein
MTLEVVAYRGSATSVTVDRALSTELIAELTRAIRTNASRVAQERAANLERLGEPPRERDVTEPDLTELAAGDILPGVPFN